MIYFAGLLGIFGSLFHTNPHPMFNEEEILDEGIPSVNRYLVPEVERVLPDSVLGSGYNNMIGYENLKISIYSPTDNLENIERDSMKAYHAAQRGLLACKKLNNQTNHGPTSPNLIEIEVMTPENLFIAVHNGKFCPPGSCKRTEWEEFAANGEVVKTIQNIFKEIGTCKNARYYTTYIEQNQPAVGLNVLVLVDNIPTLEESIKLYKKNFLEIMKWADEYYPGYFLMLKVTFRNPTTRFDVAYYNIRNHVAMYESIPTGYGNGMEHHTFYKPNYLDDLVPLHLQRQYYRR